MVVIWMKDLEMVNVILASIEIPLHAPTQSIGPTSAIYGVTLF